MFSYVETSIDLCLKLAGQRLFRGQSQLALTLLHFSGLQNFFIRFEQQFVVRKLPIFSGYVWLVKN